VVLIEGCFLMCTAGVALRGLRFHADLQPGERVLITGATGGVGIHAIQLAKHVFGAHVVALTSSEAKATVLREYGADEVIVCSTQEQLQQFHHR
jgi:NADPH:quinone reductase-like Zn-dependent oxidoreductase